MVHSPRRSTINGCWRLQCLSQICGGVAHEGPNMEGLLYAEYLVYDTVGERVPYNNNSNTQRHSLSLMLQQAMMALYRLYLNYWNYWCCTGSFAMSPLLFMLYVHAWLWEQHCSREYIRVLKKPFLYRTRRFCVATRQPSMAHSLGCAVTRVFYQSGILKFGCQRPWSTYEWRQGMIRVYNNQYLIITIIYSRLGKRSRCLDRRHGRLRDSM